jgi:competence protein ComEC
MRARFFVVLAGLLVSATLLSAQARKTLDIWVVDVEGGNATLFVTPQGESVLIDAGNGGAAAARDAGRIMEAVKDAGLTQIDHHITTHWHGDHFGALEELARQIPIRAYYDHGDTVQPQPASTEFLQKVYPNLTAKAKRVMVKPGDKLPVKGMEWTIITSGAQTIQSNLRGGGQRNAYCAAFKKQDVDTTENAQSVGSHIRFGQWRAVHPGDITWNIEGDLMCPVNRIGSVDVLFVGHHGQMVSNSEVIVHGLSPRVSIINNGTRKGGQPEAMRILLNSPGLEDVWQSHFSLLSGTEYTVPGMFVGNHFDEEPDALPKGAWVAPPQGQQAPPPPVHNGKAYWFKVSAQQDGTFTVTNTRNNFTKTYRAGAVATN